MDIPVSEYKIVETKDIQELVDEVNAGIQDGWRPLGGVTFSQTDTLIMKGVFYCQAMVR